MSRVRFIKLSGRPPSADSVCARTFRKYHTSLNLAGSAAAWLNQAAVAAKKVMDEGGFRLFEGAGIAGSYRTVFTSIVPNTTEVLLASVSNVSLGVLHPANW